MILTLYILSILFGASSDAFNDKGKKSLGHVLEALELFSLLLVPLWYTDGFGWLIASYMLLRIGLFDIVYNIVRGNTLCFHGTSSLWDRFLNMFNPPCWAEMVGRIILTFAGIMMIIQMV